MSSSDPSIADARDTSTDSRLEKRATVSQRSSCTDCSRDDHSQDENDFFDSNVPVTVVSDGEKPHGRQGGLSLKAGLFGGKRNGHAQKDGETTSKPRKKGLFSGTPQSQNNKADSGASSDPNAPEPSSLNAMGVSRGVADAPQLNTEVVLEKSGVRPSAAFPVGTDNIGPHSFRKLKLLGKGGAGTVYLVNLRGTDMVYAMKELTKEDMIKRKKILRVMTEREILASANHPFIVTMYATFQTHSRLCFVMDYCAGGEFFGVLARQPNKRLPEGAAKFYAVEVLLALEYLHYLGFFYRDLKPENILMRESGHLALTDFDLSKQAQAVSPRMVDRHRTVIEKLSGLIGASRGVSKLSEFDIVDSEPVLEAESTSFVGTLEYLAPELVKGEGQNSAVDWWTFGILIYEMMTGTTPFRAKTSEEILDKISSSGRISWDTDAVISADAKRIVKKLLRRDPKKRIGAENGASDIKKCPWFAQMNFSLIRNEQPPVIPDVPCLEDFEGVDLDREPEAGNSEDSDDEEKSLFADFDMKRNNRDLNQY